MKSAPKKRALLLRMPFVALFVALSVVNWGTDYKTSLYPEPAKDHHAVAVAKLLSEKERPSANQKTASALPSASRVPASPAAVSFNRFLPTVLSEYAGEKPLAFPFRLSNAFVNFLFYRPPPALMQSLAVCMHA